jgi:hypothetical protein
MKILVLSDTHLTTETQLPDRFIQELDGADLIIHAGDWSTLHVYDLLKLYAPVKGVYGNADHTDILNTFPKKDLLIINGFRIGIVHGHGSKKTTERRAYEAFADENVDAIIFGHSHIPYLRYFKKILLLNPGSPTNKRTQPYYSFAILHLDETIQVEFVFF